MTPESRVKKKLKEHLDKVGVYYFMPVQTGFGQASVDFFVAQDGLFFAIETKRPGVGTLTKRQQETMRQIIQKGRATCWLVTLDEEDRLAWIPIKKDGSTGIPSWQPKAG